MGDVNVTSNLFYDLVSIQYHALKGQEVYGRYIKDAQGQQEIVKFFEQVRDQDIQRAEQCHRLLTQLTQSGTGGQNGQGGGGTAEPYPTDQQGQTTGQKTGQTTGSNR